MVLSVERERECLAQEQMYGRAAEYLVLVRCRKHAECDEFFVDLFGPTVTDESCLKSLAHSYTTEILKCRLR